MKRLLIAVFLIGVQFVMTGCGIITGRMSYEPSMDYAKSKAELRLDILHKIDTSIQRLTHKEGILIQARNKLLLKATHGEIKGLDLSLQMYSVDSVNDKFSALERRLVDLIELMSASAQALANLKQMVILGDYYEECLLPVELLSWDSNEFGNFPIKNIAIIWTVEAVELLKALGLPKNANSLYYNVLGDT